MKWYAFAQQSCNREQHHSIQENLGGNLISLPFFHRRFIGNLNVSCDTKEHSFSVIMYKFQVLGQRFYINSLIRKHLSLLIPFIRQCKIMEIARLSSAQLYVMKI